MTIDELVYLLKASLPQKLTPLQEMLLRYSWEGKTYADISQETNYVKEYLSRAAAQFWSYLSNFWGESVSKNNLRQLFESRQLTQAEQQLIENLHRNSCSSLIDFPGAPLACDSRLYIERPAIETLAYKEVANPGSIIRIKAPWKMGKTSLMLRILAHAKLQKYRTVIIDFQQAEKTIFSHINKFFRWFAINISLQLQLEPKLNEYWHEDVGIKLSCTIYFEKYLLEQISTNLVLSLKDVNLIFEYPEIAKDFFSLLRSWHEQAKHIKIWGKLRLLLTYCTEVYIPLQIHQSPFNVGLPLKLNTLTLEQVLTLAKNYGIEWTSHQNKQLMSLVGGHPYLVQLAFYYIQERELTFKQLIQEAATESGIYNDYLRRLLAVLQSEPTLGNAYQEVIFSERPIKLLPQVAYKLDSMGLVNIHGELVTHSCELYRLYFSDQIF